MLTSFSRGQQIPFAHMLSKPLLAAGLFFWVCMASAQNYPNHTVKMIVELTTGSVADIAGRVVA
jgi:tripartite-type tricarboxylate transporter receptor subunit TctC